RSVMIRLTALPLALILTLTLGSCTVGRPDDARPARPAAPRAEVPVPPGIEPAALTPLRGDAMERARTPTEAIFADLADLPELQAAPVAAEDAPEPPLAAQRAYLRGRAAMRDGRREEAIAAFEQVLRLAPDSVATYRLLGQVYASANDAIRAAQYF